MDLHDQDPQGAAALCGQLTDALMKEQCVWTVAQRLAANDPEAGATLCRTLTGASLGECFYQLAETTDALSWCVQAEPFRFQCELHHFRRRIRTRIAATDDATVVVGKAEALLAALGLPADEDDYMKSTWLAYFELAGAARVGACAGLEAGWWRWTCTETLRLVAPEMAGAREMPPRRGR